MSALTGQPPQEAPLLPDKLRNVRALWLVLIIMALLAGCALLFARGSMRLSSDWQSQLSDRLTVQVMLDETDSWETQTSLAREALGSVFPGADIEIVPESESRALLKPWLGNAALPDSLPVPGLINVTGQNLSLQNAQAALDAAGLNTNIDDNSRFADQLGQTARRFVGIGLGTLILVLAAGISINIFAARASMIAQNEIIRVLVQVGASDRFISRLLVEQAFRRGTIGAAIGLGLAALLWLGLSILADWGGLGWTDLRSGGADLLWLLGLGILFAAICAAAAGFTASRQLAYERKRL